MPQNAYGQEIGRPVGGWTPRPKPERTTLTGQVCRLEPLDPARHAADLFEAHAEAADGRDWTYLSVERPADLAACEALTRRQAALDDPLHYAIVDRASGRAVGTAALMRIDPANGVIEIGWITFSPRLKRSRAGTEALHLLMTYVFDTLRYRRLEWKCDTLNAVSRRAATRLGFVFEGTFRQAIVTKGRNRDTAWYAIVDGDWPALNARFAGWLAPANFDASGRQCRPLAACGATVVGSGAWHDKQS